MTTIASGESESPTSGLSHHVPGVAMVRSYRKAWLRFDVVAGLVLAAILVPQGMAYAELAGLPPVTGLYTSIACLVGYALMGPSRVLVLGPDSSVSPLIFAAITPLIVTSDPGSAIALAGLLAIMVGLIEIGLGVAKLGLVADLLSKEVQVGYMNGLAVTIIVGQLPKLCGFSTDADGFVAEVREFFKALDQLNGTALAVGLGTIAVLVLLPKVTRKIPAVLVAVVAATVVTAVFDLAVKTVGDLPSGLPKPSLPWTTWGDVGPLLIAAVGITLVSLTDTIATSSSFAARRGEEVDANQEMIGIGSANIAAGCFQGFAVSTSGSRTAVADQAGAKSQVTGLVGAAVVVVLLVFFPTLLSDLPQPALAGIVIVAAISLMDIPALVRFWQVRRSSLLLSLAATGGVVFFGVIEGIVAAILLSILLFFQRSWWPNGELLGRFDDGWHSPKGDDKGVAPPEGIVVLRWEAALFFANAGLFRQQVRRIVRHDQPRYLVLQCEAITDIDITAADVLKQLDTELDGQGVHLVFVELRSRLKDLLATYGLLAAAFGRDDFFTSVDDAVAAINAGEVANPPPPS